MHYLRFTWWKMRLFLIKRKRDFVLGVLFIGIIWLMFSEQTAEIRKEAGMFGTAPCSDSDSENVIDMICSLYKSNEIVGDLCGPLCNQKLVRFVRCHNHKYGKYISEVECEDVCKPKETVTAILKMTHNNFSDLRWHLKQLDNEMLAHLLLPHKIQNINIYDYIITAKSLTSYIKDVLNLEYGFKPKNGQDLLSLVWNDNYNNYFQGTNTSMLFIRSLWSALYQNEYRVSKVFSDWGVFPKIYSTCGGLYLVENAPGIKSFNTFSYFVSGNPPWINRAKTAISVLQLVQRMESIQHPLQLCDLKSPHFGITPDNTVRFIDADTVLGNQIFSEDLKSTGCTQHQDCHFFDCEGWCRASTGKCSPLRTNNNLQMVCAKIFRNSGSYFSSSGGLLASPPSAIATELMSLVNDCADNVTQLTVGEEKLQFKKPDLRYVSRISDLLFESLNSNIKTPTVVV